MPGLQKNDRIRTKRDWKAARKTDRRAQTEAVSISVVYAKRRRLGIVVGRHVGNAVERNRMKRVFREYFRINRDQFPQGDCVIVAKAGAFKNDELREQLQTALRKINKRA